MKVDANPVVSTKNKQAQTSSHTQNMGSDRNHIEIRLERGSKRER